MGVLTLFFEFLKIGFLAVGGGLAAIPFLARAAEKYPQWFSLSMLADMIAISESTPGPIGVNMATYTGYVVGGVPGAFLATLALVLPGFCMMLIIVRGLQKYRENTSVNAVFKGLRPAVTGLIAAAGYTVFRLAVVSEGKLKPAAFILFVVVFVSTQIKQRHPIVYIVGAAAAGIMFSLS